MGRHPVLAADEQNSAEAKNTATSEDQAFASRVAPAKKMAVARLREPRALQKQLGTCIRIQEQMAANQEPMTLQLNKLLKKKSRPTSAPPPPTTTETRAPKPTTAGTTILHVMSDTGAGEGYFKVMDAEAAQLRQQELDRVSEVVTSATRNAQGLMAMPAPRVPPGQLAWWETHSEFDRFNKAVDAVAKHWVMTALPGTTFMPLSLRIAMSAPTTLAHSYDLASHHFKARRHGAGSACQTTASSRWLPRPRSRSTRSAPSLLPDAA